jgi:hypothetical protein
MEKKVHELLEASVALGTQGSTQAGALQRRTRHAALNRPVPSARRRHHPTPMPRSRARSA